jgi:hypothetical protein
MTDKPWYAAFVTAWRWGSFIAAHALVACVLIGCIEVVQQLVLAIVTPNYSTLSRSDIYSTRWVLGFWRPLSGWERLRLSSYFRPRSTSDDASGEQIPAGILEVDAGDLHRIWGRCRIVTFVLACLYVHPLATIFVLIVVAAYYRRPKAKVPVGITIGQLSLR